MILLKQSTAGQEVPLGYFVDSTDGDTEETALTVANTDIKLWKTGATTLANKNSGGGTHISNGIYYATLDATDTNTLGPMVIFCHVSGALPVRLECLVVTGDVYDAFVTGSAAGTDGKLLLSSDAQTGVTIPTVTTLTGHTVQTGDTYALANGANGFANIKSDSAAILTDTAEIGTAGAGLTDLGGMSTTMKGQVNAEVVDVVRTDTAGELGAVPAASPALHTMIQWIYQKLRNKETTTATAATVSNDAGTTIATATLSDDGTTFTKGEYA